MVATAALCLVQVVCLAGWWHTPSGAPLQRDALLWRIDPNTAGAAELQLLPRIGPRLAEAIIEYRESVVDGVAYESAADLARVKRIGPMTVSRLRPLLALPAGDEPEREETR